MINTPIHYPFDTPTEDRSYKLFPDVLEDHPEVFFHGTAEANLASILQKGFEIPASLGSVSFAETSSLPLRYACTSRKVLGDKGVVIAVRFPAERLICSRREKELLWVYEFSEQPEIYGYCVVPSDYAFF